MLYYTKIISISINQKTLLLRKCIKTERDKMVNQFLVFSQTKLNQQTRPLLQFNLIILNN